MKTIGIITAHCADNYGAVLQTYALKTHLEHEGFCVEIMNYTPSYQIDKYRIWPDKKRIYRFYERGGWRSVFLDLYAERIRNFTKYFRKKMKFRRFRKQYIKVHGRGIKDANKLNGSAYDCYIAGSDQIWNPELFNGVDVDGAYYLDFVSNEKRKISYAASLGASAHEAYADEMSIKLKQLDHISVRERSSKDFIERISKKNVEVVIDPVFLLSKQEWFQLIDDTPRVDGKFIFFYCFEKNDAAIELANMISEKYQLPVVHFYYGNLRSKIEYPKKCFTFDGPLDFLWYIKHAEYVISSSFHGIAFSILFEKKLYPFIFKDRGNRMTDLLMDLETGITVYNHQTKFQEIPEIDIDYKKINTKLEEIRNHSKNYLFTSLK